MEPWEIVVIGALFYLTLVSGCATTRDVRLLQTKVQHIEHEEGQIIKVLDSSVKTLNLEAEVLQNQSQSIRKQDAIINLLRQDLENLRREKLPK